MAPPASARGARDFGRHRDRPSGPSRAPRLRTRAPSGGPPGSPDADWVLSQTGVPSLTLTTCWPRFSASHRLVVRAIQVYGRSPQGFLDHLNEGLGDWLRPPASRLALSLA